MAPPSSLHRRFIHARSLGGFDFPRARGDAVIQWGAICGYQRRPHGARWRAKKRHPLSHTRALSLSYARFRVGNAVPVSFRLHAEQPAGK